MISRSLFFISQFLPCKIIRGDKTHPYLERYYLCTLLGRRFYLHRFLGGDVDEATHNHPWRQSYSLILSGEYSEEVGELVTHDGDTELQVELLRRRPFQVNAIDGDHLHRIMRAQPETWTLFWHTQQRVQPWGFLHHDPDKGFYIEPHKSSHTVRWEQDAPKGRHCKQRLPFIVGSRQDSTVADNS